MSVPSADERTLVDTNIVLYAYDEDAGDKHERARSLLTELSESRNLVFSAQVLNEAAVAFLRRAQPSQSAVDQAVELLEEIAALGEVVPVTGLMTRLALEGVKQHGLSFWDAVIWAAAKTHGVRRLYTEDFQHGRDLDGVVVLNPLLQPSRQGTPAEQDRG